MKGKIKMDEKSEKYHKTPKWPRHIKIFISNFFNRPESSYLHLHGSRDPKSSIMVESIEIATQHRIQLAPLNGIKTEINYNFD